MTPELPFGISPLPKELQKEYTQLQKEKEKRQSVLTKYLLSPHITSYQALQLHEADIAPYIPGLEPTQKEAEHIKETYEYGILSDIRSTEKYLEEVNQQLDALLNKVP